jgi:glutathione-specific gamma-glutamylcyclotransferase
MWVFGYGSLMWDGWEQQRGCIRRAGAELRGFRRIFNKASVENWGTADHPCPTLNLERIDSGVCRGIAFEFGNDRSEALLDYLATREGRAFR